MRKSLAVSAAILAFILAASAAADTSTSANERAIRSVFGQYGSQAVAVARCESGLRTWASNGQYLGLFQMGSYARSRFGHGGDAYTQARAAFAYFRASGYRWSPWSCGWTAR